MMKYLKKIIVLLVFTLALASCDKNENFEILPAQESFQIVTPSSGTVMVLNDTNLDNNALFISWKTMSETTGPYKIEAVETGDEFDNPYLLGSTEGLNFSMSVEEVNDFLLDVMGLDPEKAVSLEVRVVAIEEMTSPISIVLTPFKVEYTELYVVGSITDPVWSPADALPMKSTGFNTFEITLDLADGAEFKFLPTNIDYTDDIGKHPDIDGVLISEEEVNLSGYEEGKYKVSVDLNTFTYTVDPILAPKDLFLVGSLTGWDPATSLPFNKVDDNTFTIVVDLPDGAEFKFLPTNTSFDGDWGVDPDNEGSIIQEGEVNVSGYTGKYLVTVDFSTLTYKLSSVEELFLVGSLTGWDPATSLEMGEASLGVFSLVVDLPDAAEFKFLPQNTAWDGDWGENPEKSGYIVQDDEANLDGYAAGKYVVAVNFNTLTFTVSAASAVPTTLFLVGDHNGWDNGSAGAFTEVSTGVFEITQALSTGNNFKFLPTLGSWDGDWGENKTSKGVLEQNDEGNLSVGADGTYTITADYNKGTITVVQNV